MNTKQFVKENTIKRGAIKRIVMMNGRPLSRKRHGVTFVCIETKTITVRPISKNIDFRLQDTALIKTVNFKGNVYVICKKKEFSLCDPLGD